MLVQLLARLNLGQLLMQSTRYEVIPSRGKECSMLYFLHQLMLPSLAGVLCTVCSLAMGCCLTLCVKISRVHGLLMSSALQHTTVLLHEVSCPAVSEALAAMLLCRYSDEQVCLVQVLQEACDRATEQAPVQVSSMSSTSGHGFSDCQEVIMQLQSTNQLVQVS